MTKGLVRVGQGSFLPLLLALVSLVLAHGTSLAAEIINVGELGVAADAPYYIAMERGFFAARGLDVRLTRFRNAGEAMAPLSTGQLDVADGSVSASLFNAIAKKWHAIAVLSQSRQMPDESSQLLGCRRDLASKINGLADLKGLKVGIIQRGGVLDYLLDVGLKREKLSLKDLQVVYMDFPSLAAALRNKAIDCAVLVEPYSTLLDEDGTIFPFRRASQILDDPPVEGTIVIYNSDWARNKPQAAKDFAVAYLMAARILHRANKGGPERAEVVDILTRYTNFKDKELLNKMQWSAIDVDGIISQKGLKAQQEWYQQEGFVATGVALDQVVDDTFRQYAIGELGRYQESEKSK